MARISSTARRCWIAPLAITLMGAGPQEVPLGGSYKDAIKSVNGKASELRLSVRLSEKGCNKQLQCDFVVSGDIKGRVSSVDLDDERLDTVFIYHNCTAEDGKALADVAKAFVAVYGARTALDDPRPFALLSQQLQGTPRPLTKLNIGGVEFRAATASCSLLIARPNA